VGVPMPTFCAETIPTKEREMMMVNTLFINIFYLLQIKHFTVAEWAFNEQTLPQYEQLVISFFIPEKPIATTRR
jgi:hypothetical protein